MGKSLYVYGGPTSNGRMLLPIERLKNVNSAKDYSSVYWESIRIDAIIPYSEFHMMVPQNDTEKIIILWSSNDFRTYWLN